ncbi:MAG TPA: LysR family transcriptional regulator [Leptolyngbyaceae cyanobacterium]
MSSIDVSKIKLFQLRAFAAVAEYGSFGKAAAELALTQSAISHAIASLEEELGVMLFSRGRRGATLTPVGAEVISNAQQILHHLDQLVSTTQKARGLAGGQVRVAAIRSLATHWLPQVIAAFKQRHPQINITLTRCVNHGEVQVMLRDGSADIGLMDLYKPTELRVYELFADDYIALLPPKAAVSSAHPTWEQLSKYPLILPVPSDNSYTLLREYLAQLALPLEIAYEVNEDSAIVSMVAEGLGMSILPYFAAIPIPKGVRVRSLPQPLQRRLGAVILEESFHSPPVYAFLETVLQMSAPDMEDQTLSGQTSTG